MSTVASILGVACGLTLSPGLQHGLNKTRPRPNQSQDSYLRAIEATANMVNDRDAQRLAQARGLQILSLTWEDTGRYKSSAVGPNISDMTIQVATQDRNGFRVRCMPVIRFPNFQDKSTDIDPRDFTLLVGNEKGRPLKRVSLYEFLASPKDYLSKPQSWPGRTNSLLASRDSKVLVSAQACFLPVPQQGIATFNPVLFNYQSVSGDPAVLTILVTREGTSTTIIDNKRDAFAEGSAWGQRLFHNERGMRASLTGQRESDFFSDKHDPRPAPERIPAGRRQQNMNMVLLIQVPLKQRYQHRSSSEAAGGGAPSLYKSEARRSDVENAIIGHGALEGPFTEIDNVPIERDPRFPVRVTVQFYKATSNGQVSERDIAAVKDSIDDVYSYGDAVGSLVTQGHTGRVTEYDGAKIQPRSWWMKFWRRHELNTGDDRETAIRKLRRLLGQDYMERPVTDLYLRDLLRK